MGRCVIDGSGLRKPLHDRGHDEHSPIVPSPRFEPGSEVDRVPQMGRNVTDLQGLLQTVTAPGLCLLGQSHDM